MTLVCLKRDIFYNGKVTDVEQNKFPSMFEAIN